MSQWYAKELGQEAGVSVRTLHHYDKIGLLKPSLRESNGYRVYSEPDLSKLQRIIALKFFGFNLIEIKQLMDKQTKTFVHLKSQADLLRQKAENLLLASKSLDQIVSKHSGEKEIPWKSIIKSMEIYTMIKSMDKSITKQILTQDQFMRLAEAQSKMTETDGKKLSADWVKMISEVESYLDQDPYSEIGLKLAKKWMTLVTRFNDDKEIGNAFWNMYKSEKFSKEELEKNHLPYIPKEVIDFIDKAVYFMYTKNKKPCP